MLIRIRFSIERGSSLQKKPGDLAVAPAMLADILRRLAVDGPLPHRLAMVENFLAARQGQLALDEIFLQVKARGDKRQPALGGTPRELGDLPPVEQQPPLTKRIVIEIASGRIRADVTVEQPDLVALDGCVALLEVSLALADGLHLGPGQLDACFELFEQMIQMRRLTVYSEIPRSARALTRHRFDMLAQTRSLDDGERATIR